MLATVNRPEKPRRVLDHLQWILATVTAFLAALLLAWQALAAVDYLYPLWYEVIGIDATITEYGPQNRYRHHFEQTGKTERVRLFGAIVEAINGQGTDLAMLRYHDSGGRILGRLLTPPEIQHLEDVTRLVAYFRIAGWSALVICLLQLWVLRARGVHLPAGRHFLLWGAGVLALLALAVAISGAETLFYQLHTWVFPERHQWYFFYQESLMTLMMQAPVLFACIAAEWLALALFFLLALFVVARKARLVL